MDGAQAFPQEQAACVDGWIGSLPVAGRSAVVASNEMADTVFRVGSQSIRPG